MKSLNNTPWLNADGTKKTDKEVARLGKQWSAETWNEYLDSQVGSLDDEELIFIPDMNSEMVTQGFDLLEFLRENHHYGIIKEAFRLALNSLSKTEKRVIKKLFWEDLSITQLSEELNTSEGNIRVIKSRALQKLKALLPSQEFKTKLEKYKTKRKQEVA